VVIAAKAGISRGIAGRIPAPDQAIKPQKPNIAAIASVTTVGFTEPFSANNAIVSPAPKNRYQRGPPITIPTCSKAAIKLREPEMISRLIPMKLPY
jgi:hypothetical protein